MNLSIRSLVPALLLLLLLLGAILTLLGWSTRETRKLQSVAIEEQRQRFERAVIVSGLSPEKWEKSFQNEMGAMLGGSVTLIPPGDNVSAAPVGGSDGLSFVQALPNAPGWQARVKFAPPALLRMQMLHRRTLTVIILLAFIVAATPLLLGLLNYRRNAGAGGTRTPWATTLRAETAGLAHLAKISHERTAALAQEQDARLRAEENLVVNRDLLDRSMAERIRLGRELHDNICQTLYAVCLTLESVQKKNTLAPALAQRVDQCMAELKRLNQEVRSYLKDLEPARLQEQTFVGAVSGMLDAFVAEGGIQIDQRMDEEAVALIPTHQTADILNILREAVSNGVRHGRARHIILRTGRSDAEVALSVQDDGLGFALPENSHRQGHGLANMQARAAALGGSLKVESSLGKGTRVILTLPVASPA